MAERSTEASPLTLRQQAVFDFIRRTIYLEQRPPSIREIGRHVGISSPNGVVGHLTALVKKGRLESAKKEPRAVIPRGTRPIDVLRAVHGMVQKNGRDPISRALPPETLAALREIVEVCE